MNLKLPVKFTPLVEGPKLSSKSRKMFVNGKSAK